MSLQPNSHPRLKVLMVTRTSHITEIDMMCRLKKTGIEVEAITESDCPHITLLKDSGIPHESLDLKSRLDITGIKRLRQRIKMGGFHVVHGFSNRPISNLIWASYGLSHALIIYRGAIGHVRRWDPDCWLKWLNPRVDRISCVSHAVKKDLIKSGVRPNKLTTIYKGHDFSWYHGLPCIDLNSEFKIPENAFVVGCAANMRRVKGVDILLKSLLELPENVHALLLGEVRDPLIKTLAKKPELKYRVHFAGFRKDAPAILGSCNLAVAPSRGREGLTKSIIEPMAQGVPAVVTEAGGLPEMVEHGVSGYVVPIDDPTALAKAIGILSSDPELCRQFGERAKESMQEKFSIDQTVSNTMQMYVDVCHEKGIGS
ncbi:MAG: glycosyltransferase family 1 protein [Desulfonatronovibrio sp. MSAO_Bac4]|nr:MAG: glycosyltransferase family 1 protein [Desulfonatronovibrio sp. MSAO_Bac4]